MLILAPMQGLTEVMFRRAYNAVFPGALDLAVSPFLSLTHGDLRHALEKVDDVLPERNVGAMPVVPQLLGREPEEFVALANRLYELGYGEVNWNVGCPMRRVAAKHRGSGLLPHPEEMRAVLDAVVPQLKPRLSVKVRLGYTNPREIFAVVPVLNDYPIASVTVHPRTGRQQYGGVPDLATFAEVLPLIHSRVIYNGDIVTAADYRALRSRFPQVEDVMIGRGVLYNPLLPCEIKGEETAPRRAADFLRMLLAAILERPVTDEAKVRKIKEYWCLSYRSLHLTESRRNEVLHAATLPATVAALERLLEEYA